MLVGAQLYVVVEAFETHDPALLTLRPGQVVELTSGEKCGWIRGSLDDTSGWFPVRCINKKDGNRHSIHVQMSENSRTTLYPLQYCPHVRWLRDWDVFIVWRLCTSDECHTFKSKPNHFYFLSTKTTGKLFSPDKAVL